MSSLHHAMGDVSRLLVVLLILLGGTTGVVAAQGTTDVSLSVEASPPWTEEGPQDIVPASTPGQLLSDGERYVLVLAGSFDDAAQQRLDALTQLGAAEDSIDTVDAGETASLSYWLDVALVDGQPWGAFTTVRTQADSGIQVFTMYAAPVEGFAEGLASAQDSISVNGEPVFDGVEGDGLQDLLVAAAPAATDDEQATPNPSEEDETATDPTEEPDVDDEDKSGADDNEDLPYADVGMVGPTQYVSPQFGFEIEWTSDWELDDDFGEAVTTDRKSGIDTLNLLWNEDRSAWISFGMMEPAPGMELSDFVNRFEANAEEIFGDDATVVLADASSGLGAVVILIDQGSADSTLMYYEFRFSGDGEALIIVNLTSIDTSVTGPAIEAASADITVDGEPILVYFPPADVADVHAG